MEQDIILTRYIKELDECIKLLEIKEYERNLQNARYRVEMDLKNQEGLVSKSLLDTLFRLVLSATSILGTIIGVGFVLCLRSSCFRKLVTAALDILFDNNWYIIKIIIILFIIAGIVYSYWSEKLDHQKNIENLTKCDSELETCHQDYNLLYEDMSYRLRKNEFSIDEKYWIYARELKYYIYSKQAVNAKLGMDIIDNMHLRSMENSLLNSNLKSIDKKESIKDKPIVVKSKKYNVYVRNKHIKYVCIFLSIVASVSGVYYIDNYTYGGSKTSLSSKVGAYFNIPSSMREIGIALDGEDRKTWLEKAAVEDAEAMCWLAECYSKGIGCYKNETLARKWLEKSSEGNYILAYKRLGIYYYYGIGGDIDGEKALTLFKKSAENNVQSAQYWIGRCYEFGMGVEKDYNKAFSYYKRGYNEYDAESVYLLGSTYYRGIGTEKNYNKAVELFEKVVENKNGSNYYKSYSAYYIGEVYYFGLDKVNNYETAFKWYTRAVQFDKNNMYACYALGYCYYKGEGTYKSLSIAKDLISKAADKGDTEAKKLLPALIEEYDDSLKK